MRISPTAVAALLALTSFAAFVPAASAAIVSVCASGCDESTIQDGVDAAGSGGTVNVLAGTYPDDVLVEAPVTINGAKVGQDGRTRDATSGETIITGEIIVEAATTIDGVVFQGFTSPAVDAIASLTVRNVIVRSSSDAFVVDGAPLASVSKSRFSLDGTTELVLDASAVVSVVVDGIEASSGTGTSWGIRNRGAGQTSVSISNSTMTGFSDMVEFASTFTGVAHVNRNRLAATGSRRAVTNASPISIDASDNWFGCLQGRVPATTGTCNVLEGSGPIVAVPYLELKTTFVASTGRVGQPAGATARVLRNTGESAPGGDPIPDGTLIVFKSGSASDAASPATGAVVDGVASASLSAATFGLRTLRAEIDENTSSAQIPVIGPAPTLKAAAKVTGTPRFGERLPCTAAWDVTGPMEYQWKRGNEVMTGSTTSVYSVGSADVGKKISCTATLNAEYRDPASSTSSAVLIGKRATAFTIQSVTKKGVKLTCGASAKKACAITKAGTAYLKAVATPTLPGTKPPVSISIEKQSGTKWTRTPTGRTTLGTAAIKLLGSKLGAGTFRIRIEYAGNPVTDAAKTPYIYVRVK